MKFNNQQHKVPQNITRETKLHYRMYKDGKKWVVAGIATVALMIVPAFASQGANVFAAESTPTTQPATQTDEVATISGNAATLSGNIPDPSVTVVKILKDDGNGGFIEIGSGPIDAQGNYSIKISTTKAASGSTVYAYTTYTDDDSRKSPKSPTIVPFGPVSIKSAEAVVDGGTTKITGETRPNVKLVATDKAGKEYTGTADDTGAFSFEVPNELAGQDLSVVAINGADKPGSMTSDPVSVKVPESKPDAPTIAVEAPKDGVVKVTGTAEPGAKVTLTTPDGTSNTVTAGPDGKYTGLLDGDKAKEGQPIKAVQNNGGADSDPREGTVPVHTPDAPEVKVGTPTDGKVPVSGTGEPGATVSITPDGGTPITTPVKDDGTYSTEVPLTDAPEGTKLTVTQEKGGKTSDPATADVPNAKPATPEVTATPAKDGGTTITGKGEPGDTVTLPQMAASQSPCRLTMTVRSRLTFRKVTLARVRTLRLSKTVRVAQVIQQP
ncbi:Ig-like domain-containing protein [Lacticaseibacillus hulanensis]|uniref:Ig-like domain-containing protein n=1 Tax=Lacticaseibacillus hulanensis TaxID=2493111 RepID=UPI000FDC6B9F|nr:Ig-like domain-containing protein [Lacticaseibacillus hulanensis]